MDKTKIALMNAAELDAHIKQRDQENRDEMKYLRALWKVLFTREMKGGDA